MNTKNKKHNENAKTNLITDVSLNTYSILRAVKKVQLILIARSCCKNWI